MTSLVSYQMLLQPHTPGHAPLISKLKEVLLTVETVNQTLLRDFIFAYHTALHSMPTPDGTPHTDTLTVEFIVQLIVMATTAKVRTLTW